MTHVLDADVRVGTELAGYRIEALLGRGGMGVVYLAEDLGLERKVALKLIAPQYGEDERFRVRFLAESRLAASIDHSHIIPVYEAGEAEGLLFIAMRYVEGTDLRTRLEEHGRLSPESAVDIIGQVAAALDAAHQRGLVHRDVKPANILIGREDGREHCYLCDFGLSKGVATDTEPADPSRLTGTAAYVAPEQIASEAVDRRADVYSLGCVLYECLTGEAPFRSPRAVAVLWAHLQEAPPAVSGRNPELPAALDPVLDKALAKLAHDRFGSCAEFVEAAREALGLGLETGAWVRRHAPPLLGVAGLLVLAAVLLGVLLQRGGNVPGLPPIRVDSLVRVDPATNKPTTVIPMGASATGVAVTNDVVWVVSSDQRSVTMIDAKTNTALRTIQADRPTDIAIGEGAAWVVSFVEGTLTKLDGRTGDLRERIDLGPNISATSVAIGEDAAWVVNAAVVGDEYTVIRIGAATGSAVIAIPLRSRPADVAVGAGAVWVAGGGLEPTLSRIDPATNEVVATAALLFAPQDIAVGEGAVWISNRGDDSISRFDPETNRITGTISVGRAPAGISIGGGSVWVTNDLDRTVSRVDPKTDEVVATIDVGSRPDDIAVGADGVWVTVRAQRGTENGGADGSQPDSA